MNREPDPDAMTRSRDRSLNAARAVLGGTDPTANEIAIVAVMIGRGVPAQEIRDEVVRARAIPHTLS